jgi:hypothetical protein
MPGLERLSQILSDQPFEVLAINVGEPRYRVWKFVKLIGFDLPVLLKRRPSGHGAAVYCRPVFCWTGRDASAMQCRVILNGTARMWFLLSKG